jgi:hypothetical protein
MHLNTQSTFGVFFLKMGWEMGVTNDRPHLLLRVVDSRLCPLAAAFPFSSAQFPVSSKLENKNNIAGASEKRCIIST